MPHPLLTLAAETAASSAADPTAHGPMAVFPQVVALLAAAAGVAYLCQRLGVVPIVGFLLAGVVAGPGGLGVVTDAGVIEALGEIGVVLLLFTIGIEFSLDKLNAIRGLIFGGGALQVGLTVAAVAGGLAVFGVDWRSGAFTGCLVALSSTAIVLKLLAARGEADGPAGRFSLGVLIFQDLAVVAMVLLVPMLGDGPTGGALGLLWALGKAAAIVAVVLVVARRVMPKLLEVVARTCSAEIFLLTVVAVCFGTAWLTNLVGVSLALGAFLAGLTVSESKFRHHAMGEVMPLQILFSAAFFASVGLRLDLGFAVRNLPAVGLAVTAVFAVKLATGLAAGRAMRLPTTTALAGGLLLAQVGEFAFVLEAVGRRAGLSFAGMGEGGGPLFVAASVTLMLLTPLMAAGASRLASRDAGAKGEGDGSADATADDGSGDGERLDLSGHVVVAGYGDGGRSIAAALKSAGVPVAVVTLNPAGARHAESLGLPTVRGATSRRPALEQAAVASARVVVIPDDDAETAAASVAVARSLAPSARIAVRTRDPKAVADLRAAGADVVVEEEREGAARLLAEVLPPGQAGAADLLAAFRDAPYDAPPDPRLSRRPTDSPTAADTDWPCPHAAAVRDVAPASRVCDECVALGASWVHLRACRTCGHVGCCDSSANRHATRHFEATGHPIVTSAEPGEAWSWCYVDRREVAVTTPAARPS